MNFRHVQAVTRPLTISPLHGILPKELPIAVSQEPCSRTRYPCFWSDRSDAMPVGQLVCTVEVTTSYVPIKHGAFCTGSSSFGHLKPHESESSLPVIDTLTFKMLPLMSLLLRVINCALKQINQQIK